MKKPNIFQRLFTKHYTIDQTVGPGNNQATYLCNCGGYIEMSNVIAVPQFVDGFVTGLVMMGEVTYSTCWKRPGETRQPLPKARLL